LISRTLQKPNSSSPSRKFFSILGVLILCIPYTILLVQQHAEQNIIIIYVSQIIFLTITILTIIPYTKINRNFENTFTSFVNQQKRVDLQAEQIALSDLDVVDIEKTQLKEKLDKSVYVQCYAACYYGLLVGISVLANWSSTLINCAIPAGLYFHVIPNVTPGEAATIITLTVYSRYLQKNLAALNSYGQCWSQIRTLTNRIAMNLGKKSVHIASIYCEHFTILMFVFRNCNFRIGYYDL